MSNNVTLSQAQFNALMERISALESALNSESKVKKSSNTSKTSKTSKSSTKAKEEKPKTKEDALTKAYGDKATRQKFVDDSNKKALAFLKKSKVAYELNKWGKVAFLPFSQQKDGLFASKKEFSDFREDFRKEFPYA